MKRYIYGLLGLSIAFVPSLGFSQGYTLTSLGDLGGNSQASAINNNAQVVGESYLPDGTYHAFIWSQSIGMVDLGVLDGDSNSAATGINDLNQVTGFSQPTDSSTINGFEWQAGSGLTNIGLGTGLTVIPYGINNAGQIFGVAYPPQNPLGEFGFIYSSTTGITQATIPDGHIFEVRFANSQGNMLISDGGLDDIFYTPGNALIKISSATLNNLTPQAMNENGEVTGYATTQDNTAMHAFTWTPSSGLFDLTPNILPGTMAIAQGINNEGDVVGYERFQDGSEMPFLFDNGTLYDLAALSNSTSAGWTNLQPLAINDNGQIVGTGTFEGQAIAFLLTPSSGNSFAISTTPEPTSLTLLLCAALPLLKRRRH